jgi:TetR/AcrR family transcriptional repressor of nem operon
MTKGETTRRRIVEQAAPVFNRQGFEGSSLADLMHATGLQKGGIYRHFASKEELAAAAFDYTWESAYQAREAQAAEPAQGVERLKQLISSFVEHRSPVAGGCPVLNTAIDADDGNGVLRSRVRRALRGWVSKWTAIVAEAAARGEIRAGVDAETVATVIIAALEGGLMMSRMERSDEPLRRVERHLHRYLDEEVTAKAIVKGKTR